MSVQALVDFCPSQTASMQGAPTHRNMTPIAFSPLSVVSSSGAAYPLVNMRINQTISGPEQVAAANIAAGPCFRQRRQSVAQGSTAHLQIALKATGSAAI
jgi:hypothetical protein